MNGPGGEASTGPDAVGDHATHRRTWGAAGRRVVDQPPIFGAKKQTTFERHDVGLDPGAVPNHGKTDWSNSTMATCIIHSRAAR